VLGQRLDLDGQPVVGPRSSKAQVRARLQQPDSETSTRLNDDWVVTYRSPGGRELVVSFLVGRLESVQLSMPGAKDLQSVLAARGIPWQPGRPRLSGPTRVLRGLTIHGVTTGMLDRHYAEAERRYPVTGNAAVDPLTTYGKTEVTEARTLNVLGPPSVDQQGTEYLWLTDLGRLRIELLPRGSDSKVKGPFKVHWITLESW
jgi:hypothetical protein